MATRTLFGWILGFAIALGLATAALAGGVGVAGAAPENSSASHSSVGTPSRPQTQVRTRASRPSVHRPNVSSARQAKAQNRGIATLFSNKTPAFTGTQSGPPIDGIVHGQLTAADPDSEPLNYSVTTEPARGSVVVDPDGSYTYTLDRALLQTGATDSFGVAVSDAGSGFHLHGLASLINLLTFGLIGTSGHLATGTVAINIPPVEPTTQPPTTQPTLDSTNRLRPGDLTFEGFFRVPTGLIGNGPYATLAYGGAAMTSRVVDGQRRFFLTGHRYANDPIVELAAPQAFGTTPDKAPVATVVTYWGDIYGGRKVTTEEPNAAQPDANWTEGLLWDEAGQRLFWSYGSWYAASHRNNPVLGASVLGADGSATVQGPWRTTSDSQQTRSFALFLSPAVSAASDGATLGLGGKMQSINGSASWGPDLHATSWPSPNRPDTAILTARPLANHPITPLGQRTPRTADYEVARNPDGSIDSAGTQPAQGGVGYWTELDETTGATFVNTGSGSRTALVYAGGQAYGLIWYGPDGEYGVTDGRGYDGKGNHAQEYRPVLWFVSEADLVASAEGRLAPDEVNPYSTIDLAARFPELEFTAGLSAGQPVFAADEGRLYVPFAGGDVEGRVPYPIVAVFAIAK